MAQIYDEVQRATAAVARAKGLIYVVKVSPRPLSDTDPEATRGALDRSVVYADPRTDITEEVLRALNGAYRSAEDTTPVRH
jgi:hypothetical protein